MNTQPMPKKKALVAAASILILSILLLTSLTFGQASSSDTLQVSYIDVEQGDSIWLHASDGTDILIDGGPRSAGPTVVAYLQDGSIDDIEVIVLSHGDADHVGGLIDVLQAAIPVGAIVYNGQHHSSATYQDFLAEMQNRGLTPTPAQAGQTHTWGPVNASVLNPQIAPTGDQNEDSVVLLVTYDSVKLLFTGDIGSTTEQTILTFGTPVAAEALKVAHHGSRYSSSTSFLNAVGPDVAIISVGAGNPYGHPAQETLNRLKAIGAQICRTDQHGTVVVTTDGQTVGVRGCFVVFLPVVLRAWSPSPTPTHTPTTSPADVQITHIEYNPPGDDVQGEYVRIENLGSSSADMTGWTLSDEASHTYTFPAFTLDGGTLVKVWTKSGTDTAADLYWGSGSAIWNNTGDTAYLRDDQGTLVDTHAY